ncbi:Zn-dependent exopeptidase [Athelia psychrophila]|uniref:Zn-dependent exopeptidase n=1 Tax=Athelia psychrophila TaxID=1759441 RepID=A0A165WWF1_9AGAM|nr:Zn-dependent exopeptidase [Fibularhizoctonia sp. CBS 109695]
MNASRLLSAHAHLAGSDADYASALRMLAFFQQSFSVPTSHTTSPSSTNEDSETANSQIYKAGSPESRGAILNLSSQTSPTAWVDTYFPLLNTPSAPPLIQILGENGEVLWEAAGERDIDCGGDAGIPAFHGLSRGGDVSGELVFAGEATPEDFSRLEREGVSVQGKVVLARYGGNYRGMKVKAASDANASAIILFSSPAEDGLVTVAAGYAPYPLGPARNAGSVQRGSVQYLSAYPGDPGTRGRPAYEGVTRDWELEGETEIPWGEENLAGIVSVPVSWADGERLLEAAAAARNGTGRVRVVNSVETKITPIWNVMATIPGHIKDEVVVLGNHRDAWVAGAGDPVSGTASTHEVVRAFAALRASGWTPMRTLIFASWDAEEYSLVGSTEWAEDFGAWIGGRVVAYLNLDMSVSGSQWTAWGSPSLAHLIRRTAMEIPHPIDAGKTLWDARADQGPFLGLDSNVSLSADMQAQPADEIEEGTGVLPLGSGSDYTAFLQHLGVASVDQGFIRTPTDAVFHYHSCLDNEMWQETYADPGFHRHVAVAKHHALMALRLADAIVLPLNTTQYAVELHSYLDTVEDLSSPSGLSPLSLNHTPDFSRLRDAINQLVDASEDLDEEKGEADAHFRDLLHQLIRPHSRRQDAWHAFKNGVVHWYKVLSCVGGCGEEARKHVERMERDQLMRRTGYWADVAFKSADVEEGLSAHVSRIRALALPRPVKGDGNEAGEGGAHRDGECDRGLDSEPVRKLIRAAKRVRRANRKLIAFERGFIDEEGLKGRQWYKHLGVAPGYWLGYGATTMPGVTEALTLEKNVTLAEYEADRLAQKIEKMVIHLRP